MSKQTKYLLKTGNRDRLRLTITNEIFNDQALNFMILSGLQPGMTVFELGCGIGHTAIMLANYVGEKGRVIAVDNSEEQLEIAREEAESQGIQNIEFIQHDAYELASLDITYDFIFTRWVLMHLSNPQRVIEAIYGKLNPGGIICFQTGHLKNLGLFSFPPKTVISQWYELFVSRIFKEADIEWDMPYLMPGWLKEMGAVDLKIKSLQPILSTEREKSIYRLGLLTAETILLKNGMSLQEFEQVASELKEIEQNDTIIGSIVNLLISAKKGN